MTESNYMRMALQLAESAKGRTSPNPLVGAVVVRNQAVVGFGAHLRAGTAHAEIHALNMAGSSAEGGTMYVTLEPCNHHGRTPPCTERIIKEGIKKVYVATLDPNPLVAGSGVKALKEAGIEVDVGLLQDEAKQINEIYNKYIVTQMPFVILKTAMTLDGKTATVGGDSKWITNSASRYQVHQLRNQVDGILVGVQTICKDDPQLTTRLPEGGQSPIRIVLDSFLSIPETAQILDVEEAPTILVCTKEHNQEKRERLQQKGVQFVIVEGERGKVSIEQALYQLGKVGVTSILVEGGSQIHGSFLDAGRVDKMVVFIAPKVIGGRLSVPAIGGSGVSYMSEAVELEHVNVETFDGDICITGYPNYVTG